MGISSPFIEKIVGSGVFTAVNTQTNAGNRGFNVISRYPKVDYVSLNATELNLEERTNAGDIKSKILNVVERVSANEVLITEGKYGTILYDREDGFIRLCIYGEVIDRIGAGDTVISVLQGLHALMPRLILSGLLQMLLHQWLSQLLDWTSIEPVGL